MASPITDYPSLLAAAVDYLDRPDLADDLPGFVSAAESRFNAVLRAREMETVATVAGPATGLALPPDFLEWIRVEWSSGGRPLHPAFVEANSPEASFKHRPNGDPQYYVVVAGQVRMVPARPGAISLFYYAAVPPLSASAPTNWLLAKAPDAYLHAVLGEAYLFQKAADLAERHLGIMLQTLAALGMKADTQKVSRRTGRSAEVAASVQAVSRPE